MKRKDFFRTAAWLGSGIALAPFAAQARMAKPVEINGPLVTGDRDTWLELLKQLAGPVLSAMSEGRLKKEFVLENSPTYDKRDPDVAYMECFGRLIAGITPWLALPDDNTEEGKLRSRYRKQALAAYKHAVDPASPDYLLWRTEPQALVDAAYIAQSFLRAPKATWEALDKTTQQRYVEEFKGLRRVKTAYNNWLLFAGMVEAFLLSIGEAYDPFRIDLAFRKCREWYAGDGWYNDGPHFAMDYYNGYVIHSMLTDILEIWVQAGKTPQADYDEALRRMQRYAEFLERVISPEGTYPAFGRSVTYRMGAFQPLAQLVLMEKLPETLSYGQVRAALTAVMKRQFSVPGNFSEKGWLQLGFAGHQPNIADWYSNNGSMYLTSLVLLPLGLDGQHPFWTSAPEPWTSVKAWSGQPFTKDYAVKY